MGTLKFEYNLDDVKTEFKELLDGTSNFGRSDADFTEDEFKFKIGQIASCTAHLIETDENLKETISIIEKTNLDGFDPRYESRFNSKETFELDRMLGRILKAYKAKDDDLNHFVLLQALKHHRGTKADDFEIRTLKMNGDINNIYGYINSDFDYIELLLDDAAMAEFAETTYNNGTNNIAVFSRKAFEEYLSSKIADKIVNKLGREGSSNPDNIDIELFTSICDTIPDINMKHNGKLIKELAGIISELKVDELKIIPSQSFNIKEVAANGFYARWLDEFLEGSIDFYSLDRLFRLRGIQPNYINMNRNIQKAYDKILAGDDVWAFRELVKLSEIIPEKKIMLDFYRKKFGDAVFKDIKKAGKISGTALSDLASDPQMAKAIQEAYEIWLRNGYIEYVTKGIRLSKTKPEPKTMMKIYRELFEGDSYDYIEECIELSGIKPEKEYMLGLYRKWLESGDFEKLENTIDLTEIKPSEEIMDRFYKLCLRENSFESLEKGINITGVMPSRKTILNFYKDRFRSGEFEAIEEGLVLSGITLGSLAAEYSELVSLIQYAYKTWLDVGQIDYIEKGVELSGIKPSKNIMLDFYNNRLKDNDFYAVEQGIEFSNIKPDKSIMLSFCKEKLKDNIYNITEIEVGLRLSGIPVNTLTSDAQVLNAIQDTYRELLKRCSLDSIEKLINIFDVKPNEQMMNEFYKSQLDNNRLDNVKTGMELSEVMPNKSVMLEFYKTRFLNGEFDYVNKGAELSGIAADYSAMSNEIQKAYCTWFKRCWFDSIKTGAKISNIVPDYKRMAKDVQDTYKFCFVSGLFGHLSDGIELSGIDPDYSAMSSDIHEVYGSWLNGGLFDTVESGIELSRMVPNKETMSDFYQRKLRCLEPEKIIKGIDISNISLISVASSPEINAAAQYAYKEWLSENNLGNVEKVMGISGIKPDRDLMLEFYRERFKAGNFEAAKRGIMLSDVIPNYQEMSREIQQGYNMLMNDGKFDCVSDGINLTGIKSSDYGVYKAKDVLFKAIGLRPNSG